MYQNRVKNRTVLEALQNHEIGEIMYLEEEEKYMTYTEEGWSELDTSKLKVDNQGLTMTEYDLCKMTLSTADTLSEIEEKKTIKVINEWKNKINQDIECFLLYGQEKHIFDIFKPSVNPEYKSLGEALVDTLKKFGNIYRVDIGENNNLEIWIKYNDEEPTFLMLMEWGFITYE